MNMFIPMKQMGGNDKDFLKALTKHFEMHYTNADYIIKKLKEITEKKEKKVPRHAAGKSNDGSWA